MIYPLFVVPLLLGILLMILCKRMRNIEGQIPLLDLTVFVTPVLIWNLAVLNHIGSQSISNISEVYLLIIILGAYAFWRIRTQKASVKIILPMIVLLNLMPLALRLFFPNLPE